jgi:Berberine and berberine like
VLTPPGPAGHADGRRRRSGRRHRTVELTRAGSAPRIRPRYCDLDLPNWANAYWGTNHARLSAVKKANDPANLFHHAQSVPVGA